jgi:hypothetical protein
MSLLQDIISAIYSFIGGKKPLEKLAADLDVAAIANKEKLDWRNSIVDLMKLTGQDSSLDARKRLAQELGYQGALDGSAEMNIWLHQKVMERLR